MLSFDTMSLYIRSRDVDVDDVFASLDSAHKALLLRRGESRYVCRTLEGTDVSVALLAPAGAPPLAWRASNGISLVHRDGGALDAPPVGLPRMVDGVGCYLWNWMTRRLQRVGPSRELLGRCSLLGAHVGGDGRVWIVAHQVCDASDVATTRLLVLDPTDTSVEATPVVVAVLATSSAPLGLSSRRPGIATFLDGNEELFVCLAATSTFSGRAFRVPLDALPSAAPLLTHDRPIHGFCGRVRGAVAVEVGRVGERTLALVGGGAIEIVAPPIGSPSRDNGPESRPGALVVVAGHVVHIDDDAVSTWNAGKWTPATGPGCAMLVARDAARTVDVLVGEVQATLLLRSSGTASLLSTSFPDSAEGGSANVNLA